MKERRQSKFPSNDIAKKIALITGGNIHNGERGTSLPSRAGVNERIIAHSPRSITPEKYGFAMGILSPLGALQSEDAPGAWGV